MRVVLGHQAGFRVTNLLEGLVGERLGRAKPP